MTTIIRVKRHREEDPVEALILSCKKKKLEINSPDSDPESFQKILNFSGTAEEKDDNIAIKTVQSFNKVSDEAKASKCHVPNFRLKHRKELKARSDENRFKLLSCLRSIKNNEENTSELPDTEDELNVTIVDVSTENKEISEIGSDHSYVYDLYSTQFENDSDFNDLYMENLLSVQPLEYDLQFRNGEDYYDEEVDPDEDDSNDENNWRNDYPDTESMDSENSDEERMLSNLMKKINCVDCFELSSDFGEEEYLNYNDDREQYFYYDENDSHHINHRGQRDDSDTEYGRNRGDQCNGESDNDLDYDYDND